nr:hypothetical protein [Nonomuraea typhae]
MIKFASSYPAIISAARCITAAVTSGSVPASATWVRGRIRTCPSFTPPLRGRMARASGQSRTMTAGACPAAMPQKAQVAMSETPSIGSAAWV